MRVQHNRHLRMLSMTLVLVCFFIGAAFRWGTGNVSAFGWDSLYLICPLGYLETVVASKSLVAGALIPFLFIIAMTFLMGRVFCGWICPVPLTRKLLVNRLDDVAEIKYNPGSKGPLTVLGLSLGSAMVFGFPVFCLICPLGLSLATLVAIIRLFGENDLSFDLLIFPIVLILELVVLRHWCSRICPIGALLGLFSRWHKIFIPHVDKEKCLSEKGGICGQCVTSCPSHIDLRQGIDANALSECTKCRECAAKCPADAIKFPWR